MSQNYSSLCRAQLTYEYLHTNSTTHEFLFGALAELVDNSRDAGATKMNVFTVPDERYRGGYLLNFIDDGCGMDPVELSQVIQFGRSMKRDSGSNQIGQYGNGLKSGSMRIGKDMILLTKKGNTMSCLFLSRSFHEQEGIEEVIVPMPSWNASTKMPLVKEELDSQKYDVEMEIILKHSPFKKLEDLLQKFDDIEGTTGTLVMIYNLKLLDNGEAELDFTTNTDDILMRDPHAEEEYGFDEHVPPEKVSFRSYVSVLYSEPRMRIYIQRKKVRTKRFINCIYKPISYSYTSTRFRTRSEKEVEKADYEAKMAEEKAKEMTLQAKEALPREGMTAKNIRLETQSRQMKAQQAKIEAEVKRRIADEKKKSLKEPKELKFTFGFNIDARKCDGMYIYNCNRLIRMCEKVGPQLEGGVKCSGVVGIVDVPYLVLEPTHNKQDFADAKEYKHLLRSMAEHMLQYWKDSKIEEQGVTSFWEEFGYTGRWIDDPSQDQRYLLKRSMSVPLCVQCDSCLKWRQLQFSRKMNKDSISDTWICSMNTDTNFKSCTKLEQKPNIPQGRLQKEIKSVEQRAEQDIKRLTDKLNKARKVAGRNRPPPSPPSPPISMSRRAAPKPSVTSRPETVARSRVSQRQSVAADLSRSSKAKRNASDKAVQKALEDISPSLKGRKSDHKKQAETRKRSPSPPPVKRTPQKPQKRTTPSPTKTPKNVSNRDTRKPESSSKREAGRKRAAAQSSDDEGEDEKPLELKRKRTVAAESTVTESRGISEVMSTTEDFSKDKGKTSNDDLKFDTKYQMDSLVEARINTRWYSGKVISLKQSSGAVRIKVKFDLRKQDKFDKWFNDNDENLRMLAKEENAPSSDSERMEVTSPTNNNEISSSSIASPSSTIDDRVQDNDKLRTSQELLDGVCQKFRRCLHYFRPPDFAIEKNEVLHKLTPQQLRDFDLGKFVEDYERNIRRLVGSNEHAERAMEMVLESERKLSESKEQLRKLRLNVNLMIRNIQDGAEIESTDASDHVDTLLEAIVLKIVEATN